MGCLMSRKLADNIDVGVNDVDDGGNKMGETITDDRDAKRVKQQNGQSDNYDNYECATGRARMNCHPCVVPMNKINQENTDSGVVIDLGHEYNAATTLSKKITGVCDRTSANSSRSSTTTAKTATTTTMETSAGGQTRTKSSRQGRKRQKGVVSNDYGNLGSFLSLFVQGRRNSAVRIDTAKDTGDCCNQAIIQDGRLILVRQPEHNFQSGQSQSTNATVNGQEYCNSLSSSRERDRSSPASSMVSSRTKFGPSQPTAAAAAANMVDQVANHSIISSKSHINSGDSDHDARRLKTNNSSHNSAIINSPTKARASGREGDDDEHEDNDDDEAILFTSIQQLCCEIFTEKLLKNVRHHHRQQNADTLCLFLFGRPGSSKGELSFELVGHSSLIDVLGDKSKLVDILERAKEAQDGSAEQHYQVCPLYHYVDVSALIVANIDDRIREYNKLVAKTMRIRRDQLALATSVEHDENCDQEQASRDFQSSLEEDCNDTLMNRQIANIDDNEKTDDDSQRSVENSHMRTTEFGHRRELSIGSQLSSGVNSIATANSGNYNGNSSANNQSEVEQAAAAAAVRKPSIDHQFGIVTLSTKQRSILQLKLMKYAACVTTRWIAILINREINQLEREFKSMVNETVSATATDPSEDKFDKTKSAPRAPSPSAAAAPPLKPNPPPASLVVAPSRIYLINLIPNQLSIFKSCLYLEQNLSFTDFHRPVWAVKFERRTNIRLLKKEQAVGRSSSQQQSLEHSQWSTHRTFHFKFSHIRLPTILVPTISGGSRSSAQDGPLIVGIQDGGGSGQAGEQVANTCDSLARSLNEKLGPKYNETFAKQFKAVNRLTLLRYNPLNQCNYGCCSPYLSGADDDRSQSQSPDQTGGGDPMIGASPPRSYSCHAKLCGGRQAIAQASSATSPVHLSLPTLSDQQRQSSPLTPPPSLHRLSNNAQPETAPVQLSASFNDLTQSRPISRAGSANCSLVSPSLSFTDVGGGRGDHQHGGADTSHSLNSCSGDTKFLPTSSPSSSSPSMPKWAIELELIDAQQTGARQHSISDDTSSIVGTGWLNRENTDTATECLHTYHPPPRAHCRSPLMFGSSGTSATAASSGERHFSLGGHHQQQTGHYSLVPTQVAYANGKSQTILEVKRVHKRTIKCKTRSDLVKLHKLIGKVCQHLTSDLDSWLGAAILAETGQASCNLTQAGGPGGAHLRPHHNGSSAKRWQHGHHLLQPSLVTYTIRVDLARLNSSGGGGSKSQQREAAFDPDGLATTHYGSPPTAVEGGVAGRYEGPHLKSNMEFSSNRHGGRLTPIIRPASAMDMGRPLGSLQADNPDDSSRAASSGGADRRLVPIVASKANSNSRRNTSAAVKRHVQFCFDQVAAADHHCPGADCMKPAQRRFWISETLFASCNDARLFSLMNTFVELLQAANNSISSNK